MIRKKGSNSQYYYYTLLLFIILFKPIVLISYSVHNIIVIKRKLPEIKGGS